MFVETFLITFSIYFKKLKIKFAYKQIDKQNKNHIHSCLNNGIFNEYGLRAARFRLRISAQIVRAIRNDGTTLNMNAARVFIIGRGLPERIATP